MNAKSSLILAGAALATSVLAVAPASGADRVLATAPPLTSLTPVDAHGGNIVWGQSVGGGPREYFVRDAGGRRPFLPGMSPSDLDLGARRGGGTQAVFTGAAGFGDQLFSYDFRSGATRELSSLTRPRGFETSPSVWEGRFAFVRVDEFDEPVALARDVGLFVTGPLRRVTRVPAVSTELRGPRIAYITHRNQTTALYVATLARGRIRSCFIARATSSSGSGPKVALSNPALTGANVYWLRKDARAPAPTIRRRRLPGRGCRSRGREERSREVSGMESFAVEGRRFFYTTPTQVREATDPRLAFTR